MASVGWGSLASTAPSHAGFVHKGSKIGHPSALAHSPRPSIHTNCLETQRLSIKCESSASAADEKSPAKGWKLGIGSPVIIIEAPKMIKTATSVPSLRVNSGIVSPGDVGRIMSRKPKDVWAVRLKVGTYLIDGRYFRPLQLDGQLDATQASA